MKIVAVLGFVWVVSVVDVNCRRRCPHGAWTDDPEGRCCVFPFTYVLPLIGSKTTFYSCTDLRHNRDWCSLDAEYKGRWANCECDEVDQEILGCQNGGKCQLPYSLGCECAPGFSGKKCEHRD